MSEVKEKIKRDLFSQAEYIAALKREFTQATAEQIATERTGKPEPSDQDYIDAVEKVMNWDAVRREKGLPVYS